MISLWIKLRHNNELQLWVGRDNNIKVESVDRQNS